MQLSITATDSGGTRVLAVCGEVDVSSADELRQALDEALSAGVTAVEARALLDEALEVDPKAFLAALPEED